jgi:hypothetical protein
VSATAHHSIPRPGLSLLQRCLSNARDACVCLCGAPRGGDPARSRSSSADGARGRRRCPSVRSRSPSPNVAASAADVPPRSANAAAEHGAADVAAGSTDAAAEHGAADVPSGSADAASEHGAGDDPPGSGGHARDATSRRSAQLPATRHGEHGPAHAAKRRQPAKPADRATRRRGEPPWHGRGRGEPDDAAVAAARESRWADSPVSAARKSRWAQSAQRSRHSPRGCRRIARSVGGASRWCRRGHDASRSPWRCCESPRRRLCQSSCSVVPPWSDRRRRSGGESSRWAWWGHDAPRPSRRWWEPSRWNRWWQPSCRPRRSDDAPRPSRWRWEPSRWNRWR